MIGAGTKCRCLKSSIFPYAIKLNSIQVTLSIIYTTTKELLGRGSLFLVAQIYFKEVMGNELILISILKSVYFIL
jgi:hypothetical protein